MAPKFRKVIEDQIDDEEDDDEDDDEEEEYNENCEPKFIRAPMDDRRRSKIIKIPEITVKSEHITVKNRRFRIEEELFRACVSEGMTREDIMRVMDMKDAQLATVEKRVLATDGQRQLSMSAAHRYYVYCLQQEQCVRDLDYFIQSTFDSISAWNNAAKVYGSVGVARKILGAVPGNQGAILAIKAKSEILDRVIKMGQDIGIIEKRAKEIRVSGNLNLAALPTEELRNTLSKKLDQFCQLVEQGNLPTTYKTMIERSNERRLVSGRSKQSKPVVDAEFVETDSRSMDG